MLLMLAAAAVGLAQIRASRIFAWVSIALSVGVVVLTVAALLRRSEV